MSALIEHPTLKRRIEESVAKMLRDIDALAPVSIREGITDADVETPFISINATRDGERVRASGAYDCTVTITLHTTASRDDQAANATTDEELLEYDAGIEEMLFENSVKDLADTLTANAQDVRVDAVFGPTSDTPEFSEARRDIAYEFSCVAMRTDAA